MDQRLLNAARLGDVVALSELLEEDPLILERVALAANAETPLHIAALAGKSIFVKELVNRKPSFAKDLNQDGLSPMHIASAVGHIEVVKDLLRLGQDLCYLKDNEGRTPLHYAAIRGRVEIIEELVSKCAQIVKEVTPRGETALHLAVKNKQFEALRVLVNRLGINGDVIHTKDDESNTILQLAMVTKQRQALEFVRNHIEANNQEIIEVSLQDQVIGRMCLQSQASQARKETMMNDSMPLQQPIQSTQYIPKETLNDSTQNAMLVVACLIATVTYQAGLTPPSTIWNENTKLDLRCIFHQSRNNALQNLTNTCPAGVFYSFMSFNTAGFFASILLIFLYRTGPLARFLLGVSLLSMIMTYFTTLVAISPSGVSFLFTFLIMFIIFGYCALAYKVAKQLAKKFLSILKVQKPSLPYSPLLDA